MASLLYHNIKSTMMRAGSRSIRIIRPLGLILAQGCCTGPNRWHQSANPRPYFLTTVFQALPTLGPVVPLPPDPILCFSWSGSISSSL